MANGTVGTVRLADCGPLRDLVKEALSDVCAIAALSDVCAIAALSAHKREQQLEMELIRDRAYEAATSGTEAAGPARERVGAVLRLHGEANAYMDGLAALSERFGADGLDAELTEGEARTLVHAAGLAAGLVRELVVGGLYREVDALDGEIMGKMPLAEDALQRLAEELSREDAPDGARDCKVIDIADWRRS